MKFVVSRSLHENPLLLLLLKLYSILSLVFVIFDGIFEKFRWGWTAAAIEEKILGNPDLFIEKMSLLDLVIESHIQLFLYSIFLVMSFLIFLQSSRNEKLKFLAVVTLFSLVIVNVLTPFAIAFLAEAATDLKIVTYWAMNGCFLLITLDNIYYLFALKGRAKGSKG